jgi:hypothetical protein
VAQTNTSLGTGALVNNTTGVNNTAIGNNALFFNTTGSNNTATGVDALVFNSTGDSNTAIGHSATVSARNLTNATAIGAGATVNASNKVRLGSNFVTVIEGQVGFTAVSDKTQKENFQPVDGEEVLGKIRGFELSSWNFIGHDPKEFRPLWSDGARLLCGLRPRWNGTDRLGDDDQLRRPMAGILMIAVQALEKRTAELKQKEARIAVLESRLEALELRKNHSIQLTAEKSLGDEMVDYYSKSKQHH